MELVAFFSYPFLVGVKLRSEKTRGDDPHLWKATVKQLVDDFEDLLKVMNSPELTEFQYLVLGDEWIVSIK